MHFTHILYSVSIKHNVDLKLCAWTVFVHLEYSGYMLSSVILGAESHNVGQQSKLHTLTQRQRGSDQINHETVNLLACSIVWKGIIAH